MADNTQTVSVFGVFTTDADLKIKVWDNALVRFTGVSAEQARGKLIQDLFPEIETRGLAKKLQDVLDEGTVEVLAPAFHRYFIPCQPQVPSTRFERMLQRTTIAPVVENEQTVGVLVTIEDVTARVNRERELAELLNSPDPETRLRATETLASGSEIDNELALVPAISDQDWRVRQAAVQGLAKRSAPEAIHALLEMMREDHRNLAVLNSALQVLSMVEVDALQTLVEFLQDEDADLRMQAALALGEQRDEKAVPALLAALADENVNVRFHVIEALGKIRDARAVEPLAKIAESGDFFLAFPALDSLRQIGEPGIANRLIELLSVPSLRDIFTEILGALGDETAVAPLATVLNDNPDAAVSVSAALAALHDRFEEKHREGDYIAEIAARDIRPSGAQNLLTAIGEAEVKDLRELALVIGWLRGPAVDRTLVRLLGEPSVRSEVLEALTHHGEGVISLLVEQVESDDLETRRAAVIALGRLGYRRATVALTKVLETDPEIRIEAANALAKIGDEAALESLLRMVGDTDGAARQAVVGALNSIGAAEMPQRIKPMLQHEDPLVRESAAKIAGYFGYANCAEQLINCCSDEDERVRKAAVEQLPFLDDQRAVRILVEHLTTDTPRVRAAAAAALGNVQGSDIDLIVGLRDDDTWVRYFAAKSLGRLQSTNGVPSLVALVEHDSFNHVRIAALEALGQIGGDVAVNTIEAHLHSDDRDVARVATEALREAKKENVN